MSTELNNTCFTTTEEVRRRKNDAMKEYYKNNKETMKDWFKTYYKNNIETIRERSKTYYWSHVEGRREYARVTHLKKQKGCIKEEGPEQYYKYRKRQGKQETEAKEDKKKEIMDKIVVSFN